MIDRIMIVHMHSAHVVIVSQRLERGTCKGGRSMLDPLGRNEIGCFYIAFSFACCY